MKSKCAVKTVIRMRGDEATDLCALSCHSRVFHITTMSLSLSYLLQSLALNPNPRSQLLLQKRDCLISET